MNKFLCISITNRLKEKGFTFELPITYDGKEYIRIGKGVLRDEERDYPVLRLFVKKWGIARYLFGGKSIVVFGIGKWDEEYVGK